MYLMLHVNNRYIRFGVMNTVVHGEGYGYTGTAPPPLSNGRLILV